MRSTQSTKKSQGLGFKLSATNFALAAALTGALVGAIGYSISSAIEQKEESEMMTRNKIIAKLIEATDRDLKKQVTLYSKSLHDNLKGDFEVDPVETLTLNGLETPKATLNGYTVNGETRTVDELTKITGGRYTIFAKKGDEFYRVSTSLLDEQGNRSIGTTLNKETQAYKNALQGKPYTGLTVLFGKQYMTHYEPIKNPDGELVGVTFTGMDFTELVDSYKTAIRNMKVGETGYYYVLDTRPGPTYGNLIVHPASEGSNVLDMKDSNGRAYIQEMLQTKEGVTRYPWINEKLNETEPREKVTAFTEIPQWNWLLANGTYVNEYTGEIDELIQLFSLIGLAGLLAVSAVWLGLVRSMVIRPVNAVDAAAEVISTGDLTVTLPDDRNDEIGHLMKSINLITRDITSVVGAVRSNAEGVAAASAQITQSNADLAGRTEHQASALTQTAASMEELEATVKQNADNAKTANQLADQASEIALRGGVVVDTVVQTMQGITASSHKIADIVNVIDSIAFQTNILALNAAVEAARAGEQGKGFAVVASEVRSLSARSASAAKEIKDLITESVNRVTEGSAQANEAGETMREIVSSIQRVTDIVNEISAASHEQSQGVSQIAQAISQMDGATQQNAALVEQMSSAAKSLQSQADELVHAVAVFKMNNSSKHTTRQPPPQAPVEPRALARPTNPSSVATPARRGHVSADDDFVEF